MTMRKLLIVLTILIVLAICAGTLALGGAATQNPSCQNLSVIDCITRHGWQNLSPWNSVDHDKWRQMFYSATWGRRFECTTAQANLGWVLFGGADTHLMWGNSSSNAGHFFDLTTSTGTGNTTSVRVIVIDRNLSDRGTFLTLTHESAH